jgi:DNA primase large subunit
VPDLVEKRKVFLKAGWAYVPSRDQSSIVFQEFETNLMKALEVRSFVKDMRQFSNQSVR